MATHPVLVKDTIERLNASRASKIVLTDTVEISPEKRARMSDKFVIISVADLLADAIITAATPGGSVSALSEWKRKRRKRK